MGVKASSAPFEFLPCVASAIDSRLQRADMEPALRPLLPSPANLGADDDGARRVFLAPLLPGCLKAEGCFRGNLPAGPGPVRAIPTFSEREARVRDALWPSMPPLRVTVASFPTRFL